MSDKHESARRTLDHIIRYTSTVGESTTFTGTFTGGEDIVVRGNVRGDSEVDGAVVIAHTGHWFGNLTADIVVIAGEVQGDVRARQKLEIHRQARVMGNLHCPHIAIESGAVHQGHIDMKQVARLSHFDEKRGGELAPGE